MGLRQAGEHLLRAVERSGVDRRSHRQQALSFLMHPPAVCGNTDADRLAWIASVQAETARLDLQLPPGVTVRNFFRRPPNGHQREARLAQLFHWPVTTKPRR